MTSKIIIQIIFLAISFPLLAQSLTIKLSQHPNKRVYLSAIHGIRNDTVGTVVLDQLGNGKINYGITKLQTGLGKLTVQDNDLLNFDFVICPSENPTLTCDGEYVNSENTVIINSPENDHLNRWFDNLREYKQKIIHIQELSQLYQRKITFSKQLDKEKRTLEAILKKQTDTINKSHTFSATYLQFIIAQEEKLLNVWQNDEQRTMAKNYFVSQIDFEALHGSSMWSPIINNCMEAYAKESPYYETFGLDVVENLKRIRNPSVYEDLIVAAITITEKFSWNKDQNYIVDFVVKDNKIESPQGEILKIIQSHNLSVGKKAPDLVLINRFGSTAEISNNKTELKTNELNSRYSLLLFYKSGCGSCEITIEELKRNYQNLKDKGCRILAIAADTDIEEFQKNATTFPWPDSYCDFLGKNNNFKNFAVTGAPAMYLLDSNGIIMQKLATVTELMEWCKYK